MSFEKALARLEPETNEIEFIKTILSRTYPVASASVWQDLWYAKISQILKKNSCYIY